MMLIAAFLTLTAAQAFRLPVGAPCNITNSHLDGNTKAFVSDCDWFSFCSANGTCLPRGCRRDEFVLSSLLDENKPLPPMCGDGYFCPDDASACLPLVAVGGRCQLNRDDECSPPGAGVHFSVPNEWDQAVGNGSICLLGRCMWTNVTLGQPCVHESTTYIGYDLNGTSVTNEVIRDNCVEGEGYCDLTNSTCVPLRALGETCKDDRECGTFNCGDNQTCLVPAESTVRIGTWVYVLVGLSTAAAMGGVLVALVLIHNKTQAEKRAALQAYRDEQKALRNSILSFHSALSSTITLDKATKDHKSADDGVMYRTESVRSGRSSSSANSLRGGSK